MADNKYKPTIGLEIHAELKTKTKMFSNSINDPEEERPNVNINPVDLGHPGTLPTINKKAIEHMIKIGLAVDGEIADYTEFDRKNYFYPDIPKGYQITQFKYPIVSGGKLAGVDITRIHLEEDTGLSKHDRGDFSLVDFNRAGIPLMELVTEPVIHSAEEAVKFAKELQLLLRYLGVADANMEKGEMRVEANISISPSASLGAGDSDKLGTKVEVKNLNSFKSVEKAINLEIDRMSKLLDAGRGDEIVQETRGFDETKQKTFSQRRKETSDDYRYFPEPDLPKMNLHEVFDIKEVEENLPELPNGKRERFASDYGIKEEDIEIYVGNRELADYFENVIKEVASDDLEIIKTVSNFIISDALSHLNKGTGKLPKVADFAKLIEMFKSGDISSRVAKDVLLLMVDEGLTDPETYAKENDLMQKSNTDDLKPIIEKIISENQNVVEDYKKGKESALQFFVGQVMRETKGGANPSAVISLLKELLQ